MILVTLFRVTRSANTPHPGIQRDARNLNFKVVFIKINELNLLCIEQYKDKKKLENLALFYLWKIKII